MEQFEKAYMEEQILLLLDNELDAVQAGKVRAQMEAFPEYKALYEEYASVYLIQEEDENIPVVDFSYLEKGEAYDRPPMQIKRSLKPAWGIAVGIALILATGILLKMNNNGAQLDDGLAKSDKIHQAVQAPMHQLATDSLERKPDLRKSPAIHKPKAAPKKNERPELRLALQDNNAPGTALTSIYEGKTSGVHPVKRSAIHGMYTRNNPHYANLPSPQKSTDELKLETSNGLLPDMIKAGQWIFGDHKKNTTVEIAIGNNEKRSIKFKL